MATDRTVLHEPLVLPCGQVLPNRLMKAALSEGLADPAHAPDVRLERLYRRWGHGGWGLIVTGNVMVDAGQLGEPGNVAVEDDRHLDALSRWAKTTQDGGSPIWMQLNHPGRQANPLATRHRPVAPSAIASGVPGLPTPRALSGAEIDDLVGRFATTAGIAEAAGFDGVQIHGAHGYLVSQFLSPRANQREDEWGGDAPRRMRFLLEIIRRVRAEVAPSFAVGVKLNSADFQRGGFSEDESRLVVQALAAEGIDLLEISGGSYEKPVMMGSSAAASTRAREAYFLEYAESVRAVAGELPLAVTGGFRTPAAMAAAIGDGACDVIGLGRPGATVPGAGTAVLDGETLPDLTAGLTLPRALTRFGSAKSLEGALDLMWHTDQLHRIGAGQEPDLGRGRWRTLTSAVRRNGFEALRPPKRSVAAARPSRKFAVERAVGRYVANPAVRALDRLGVTTSFAAELETTGRRTGQPRRVPVSAAFDDAGAWVISQHGTRSGWGSNIAANPRVRIRRGAVWVEGTAVLVPDDDVAARTAGFAPHPVLRPLVGASFRALQTTPVSVRITFS